MNGRVSRVFACRIWILGSESFQIHSQPHDSFLKLGDCKTPFAAAYSVFESLDDLVNVFAQLLVQRYFLFEFLCYYSRVTT